MFLANTDRFSYLWKILSVLIHKRIYDNDY